MKLAVRIHQAGTSFADLRAVWQEADRLGYDGATLFDVLQAPALEPWTALTALTAMTERIAAVPLVLSNTYRHPVVLSKMAATLDALSGGRLVLGIGAGGGRSDHERHGIEWEGTPERVARLEDAVRIMRFLWSGEEGTIETEHYGAVSGPGRPAPAQSGGPPVLIGGHGTRYLLPAAARAGDLCNMEFDLGLDEWEERKALLERFCREAGHESDALGLTHNANVVIGQSEAEVRAAVEGFAQARGLSVEDAGRRLRHAVVGTPDECLERLERYRALGMRWVFLLFPDLPDARSLRLFGERVLPRLNGWKG